MKLVFLILISVLIVSNEAWAERIVVIGDSHSCGDFGKQLVRNLGQSGKNEVLMYCAGGLSTQHWLRGYKPPRPANNCLTYSSNDPVPQRCLDTGELPALGKILRGEFRPSRVIVALGSNNLAMNAISSFDSFADELKSHGLPCHWVGPPKLGSNGKICQEYGHNLDKVVKALRSASTNTCEFIDSRNVTSSDNTPDCIHRYGKAARDWADGVSKLIHPQSTQDNLSNSRNKSIAK